MTSTFIFNGVTYTELAQANGWIPVADTWTYASASTITIPSDGTTKYQKGMPLRFKQGGGYKYYNIYSVTSTLITVIVNTDFTVANTAITDIAVSFLANPFGFPQWFTRTATGIVSGSGGSAGTYAQSIATAEYYVNGQTMYEMNFIRISNVGSWSGSVLLTGAVPATSRGANISMNGGVWAQAAAPGTKKGNPVYASSTAFSFVSAIGSALLQWSAMAANDEIHIRDNYQF